jgi:MFS family permease
MKKILATIGAFTASQKTATAATTGGIAILPGLGLTYFGFDLITWGLGVIGGVVLLTWAEPTTRSKALGTVLVSAILGGVVAPFLWGLLLHYQHITNIEGGQYPIAFLLGVGWPWLIKKGIPMLQGLIPSFGKNKGKYYD